MGWLYEGASERLPASARTLIAEENSRRISAISALELAFAHEIGKTRDPAPVVLAALRQGIGLEVADASFADLANVAVGLTWTRNPFHRLIAAHAIVADAPLITGNHILLKYLSQATWD